MRADGREEDCRHVRVHHRSARCYVVRRRPLRPTNPARCSGTAHGDDGSVPEGTQLTEYGAHRGCGEEDAVSLNLRDQAIALVALHEGEVRVTSPVSEGREEAAKCRRRGMLAAIGSPRHPPPRQRASAICEPHL